MYTWTDLMLISLWEAESGLSFLFHTHIDDSRTVWPNQPCLSLAQQSVLDPNHVLLWDTFSDTHDQGHFCLNSFINGSSSKGRRDINDRSCCSCLFFGLKDKPWSTLLFVKVINIKKWIQYHDFNNILESEKDTTMKTSDVFMAFSLPLWNATLNWKVCDLPQAMACQ